MLLFFGIPLLYLEMIVGQWLHVDNIRVWKQLVPWLGGLGYASTLVNEGPHREAVQTAPGGLQVLCLYLPHSPIPPCPPTGLHVDELL